MISTLQNIVDDLLTHPVVSKRHQFHFRCDIHLDHIKQRGLNRLRASLIHSIDLDITWHHCTTHGRGSVVLGNSQIYHSFTHVDTHYLLWNASAELCVLEEGDLLHVLGAAPVAAPRLLQHSRRHHHHLKEKSQDQRSLTEFDHLYQVNMV